MAMNCVHHWLIDPSNGTTSNGRCCKCGEVKVFNNYEEINYMHLEGSKGPFNRRPKLDSRPV